MYAVPNVSTRGADTLAIQCYLDNHSIESHVCVVLLCLRQFPCVAQAVFKFKILLPPLPKD